MLLVLESETLFLIRQKFSNAAVLPRAIWVFKLVTAPTGRMLQTNSWQGLDCLELFSPFPDLPCCPAVNNAIMTYYFLFPQTTIMYFHFLILLYVFMFKILFTKKLTSLASNSAAIRPILLHEIFMT